MVRELNRLNVLMVTPRYFPYMGGIETHVHEVGKRLVKSGINITLLTTMPHMFPIDSPQDEVIEGMRVIRVQAWPQRRDYYIAPAIYSIIEQGGWDLIHCQGCHTFVPPLAMLAAKKAKIPYVITFHTGGHSSRLRTSIRGIQWKLQHQLMAGAQKLIGVSHFEANYFRDLLSLPAELFTVVPNGADLPRPAMQLEAWHSPLAPASLANGATHLTYGSSDWAEGTSAQLAERKGVLASTSTRPLILSVGRLERYKGHQHIITALPKIREWYPDARLLIVGSGPYEMALRACAQKVGMAEHVEIRAVPADDRHAMAALFCQATLVVLLSEYEAHPIAVMEALALQRPVLVGNTSGLRELAEQKFVRAISPNSTPEEIAAAAIQQIEEPLLPQRIALPTWEDCTQKLEAIYTLCARRDECVS